MIFDNNYIFKTAVKILINNNINYWVCHGTLLGIIRDNKLLSWDSDIDFAVWEDEYSKEDILKIFLSDNRFKKEIIIEEINSLHFLINEKRDKRKYNYISAYSERQNLVIQTTRPPPPRGKKSCRSRCHGVLPSCPWDDQRNASESVPCRVP